MQNSLEYAQKATMVGTPIRYSMDFDQNKNFIDPGMTLTDITEFLMKEDAMLQRTITKS